MDNLQVKKKGFFLFQRKKRNQPITTEDGVLMLSEDELSQWSNHENPSNKPSYLRTKFSIAVGLATLWTSLCFYLSIPWIRDLAHYVTLIPSVIIIFSIALLPSYMYMFLILNYLFDRRKVLFEHKGKPFISILIAAYNEEKCIGKTLRSLKKQDYAGEIEIILIDDGSSDETIKIAQETNIKNLTVINAHHGGKAAALNIGLSQAKATYIITVDADTILLKTAISHLVNRLLSAPNGTVACAGAIYIKNTPKTLLTKIQAWDYFLAISVIKRSQSFLQGTLVAQGAFSIYEKKIVQQVGGWPDMVGEDIVLTWAMLEKGYYIDFAENAIAFTNAPTSYKQFFFQRSRWARGLIEAFRRHPRILFRRRLSTFFIYWNACFILLDTVFFFVFIPGAIAALFGYFFIAGPMTLVVLPLGFLSNYIFFSGQKKLFKYNGLHLRENPLGFFIYVLFYQFMMNPSVIHGYLLELTRYKKSWGTK